MRSAIFGGVVNSAFLPSRSVSVTPRAREQRVQTWIRTPAASVSARISLNGGQPNGTRFSATGPVIRSTASLARTICASWPAWTAPLAMIKGIAGLLGAGVVVGAWDDLEMNEPARDDGQRNLSFQESTGNSTGPERDVLLGALLYRLLDEDVADLEPPAGLEHARHVAQRGVLVGHQVEHAVGDHHVGPAVFDG